MTDFLGPALTLDALERDRLHLAAIVTAPKGSRPEPIDAPGGLARFDELARIGDRLVLRARFDVPSETQSRYRWRNQSFDIHGLPTGDMRFAYTSCDGEEHGDLDRAGAERNVMWQRLEQRHRTTPLSLMLHGGDQVYADEAILGHPLSQNWPDEIPRDPGRADLDSLRGHLRAGFLERYEARLRGASYASLAARVPALSQWDDHDICDGWGSLPRSRTYSPVGQTLFAVAREMALLFQHGTVDGDLPARFADRNGNHLGWSLSGEGFAIHGPDLRSERTRRQIMGPQGWADFRKATLEGPAASRQFVMSSVPLLGPRLSILEAAMVATPRMQRYEDDLRDQWQSRAHREEWRRMLRHMDKVAQKSAVTILSGEIHLATRATMGLSSGATMHQLVASGITHRVPPRAWARFLGLLSRLPESPLPRNPIRIRRIPGQRQRYVADRNLMLLERTRNVWQAVWDFETSGPSAPLTI